MGSIYDVIMKLQSENQVDATSEGENSIASFESFAVSGASKNDSQNGGAWLLGWEHCCLSVLTTAPTWCCIKGFEPSLGKALEVKSIISCKKSGAPLGLSVLEEEPPLLFLSPALVRSLASLPNNSPLP